MLDSCEGFSKEFKRVIHKLLDIIFDHFIEIGSIKLTKKGLHRNHLNCLN